MSNFLEETSSLSRSIVFFCFFVLIAEEGFLISPCYFSELCIQMDISFVFFFAFLLLSFSQLFVRPPQTAIFRSTPRSLIFGFVPSRVGCVAPRKFQVNKYGHFCAGHLGSTSGASQLASPLHQILIYRLHFSRPAGESPPVIPNPFVTLSIKENYIYGFKSRADIWKVFITKV